MSWNEITQSDNNWDDINYYLYVLSGYWEDGYTVDSPSQWTDDPYSSNTWVVIG